MAVYTSSFVIGLAQFGDEHYFIMRQTVFACAGGFLLICAARLDYHRLRPFALPIMLCTIAALVAVLLVGETVNGARRWLGPSQLTLQPAEFAKLTVIIYLAAWLEGKGESIKSLEHGLIPFVVIIGIVAALIMFEPSLGTTFIIMVITVTMFFVAGASIFQMVALGGAGAFSVAILATVEGYRMERLTAFFNAGADTTGNNFQTTQSIMAIGNGGIHGLGLGASRAKFFYIPESHTDGVFAIISEELGLIAALALLVLFVAFMIRGYTVANRSKDGFGALLATGITTWVIAQAMLNIGGITRVIPLTGVPLPFLSYGGSALMAVMAGVGVLISVSRFSGSEHKTATRRAPEPPPSGEHRIVHRRKVR
ncbi:hypothetical protein AYO38_01660 [bacterium SCGC AG-212-C10]|nr:hypothetical protein AYO38_01660 [bacterium SCGC AG-212-C10]